MTRRQAVRIAKSPVTWILVADGRRAQVYTREKVEKLIPMERQRNQFEEIISHEPVPIPGMKWEAESAEQYQVGRNATGMVFDSASSSRSMSEPHLDVREEIKLHLARTIAEQLNIAKLNKAFDRLVLIASPKMLGEIKKYLDEKVLRLVIAEMPKDLTHFDAEELENHLGYIA